jgi:hypothetical protein
MHTRIVGSTASLAYWSWWVPACLVPSTMGVYHLVFPAVLTLLAQSLLPQKATFTLVTPIHAK